MRSSDENGSVCLFLCGDVMTGRGIDQVLPHPGNPVLYESCVRDARGYVCLAEAANGPIQKPVNTAYIWGDALAEFRQAQVDVKIINLETSVTRSEDAWPDKGIHYRMHPRNIGCITAAAIDCCALANNHVLDWGYDGLAETLGTLDEAGLARAGAGCNATEAATPAVIGSRDGVRVLVFSLGSTTSGIPVKWSAAEDCPGVSLLTDLSKASAMSFANRVQRAKRPGDVAVASIHWGGNWGYDVPGEQIRFAHWMIDAGVDVVHGHSSHHVKAIEVYRDRLILYGCGDFLTDYEGISGHERFRSDLTLMYLPRVDPRQGKLAGARLVPMQVRRFRLNRGSTENAQWLCDLLNREGAPFGTGAVLESDDSLTLKWR